MKRTPLVLTGSLSLNENEGGFASPTVSIAEGSMMFAADLAVEIAKWAGVYADHNRGGNLTSESVAVRRVHIVISEID